MAAYTLKSERNDKSVMGNATVGVFHLRKLHDNSQTIDPRKYGLILSGNLIQYQRELEIYSRITRAKNRQ